MKSPCDPAHLHKSVAEGLENRLVAYALAAGATVIAASGPAQALRGRVQFTEPPERNRHSKRPAVWTRTGA